MRARGRMLMAMSLFLLLAVRPATGAQLTEGLIGYWQFDGDGADRSTLGNHLTIYGDAGFADGLFGQALDLDADANQYAARTVNDGIYNFGGSDITVQAWVAYHSTEGEQTLVEKFTGSQGPGWTITKLESNAWHFGGGYSTPLMIDLHVWHHVLVRLSGGIIELFFDGPRVGQAMAPSYESTPQPLLIGERQGEQQFPVNGRIDEVAFWNRALSNNEIAYLWNGGAGNTILPLPPPLLALSSGRVAECAPAHVLANLTNSQSIQAFSFGIAHDPAIATLTAIDYEECAALQTLNGGNGPEYFGVDLDAGIVHCPESISAGGTVYCIASQSEPSTETIPAGENQPIARLTYAAAPGNVPDTQSAISIVGCLGGELPREVIITVDGFSVTPEVSGGTLTIDPPACRFIRGDVNRDGRMDISDVVCILMYLFEGGRGPLRCEDAGDANDDGFVDIGDAVRILGRLFGDGLSLAPPYPSCGTDPTLDALRCAVSACE